MFDEVHFNIKTLRWTHIVDFLSSSYQQMMFSVYARNNLTSDFPGIGQ